MFKLSKESKRIFIALLPIPLIWMMINHLGYLDYLKTKTVDWRMVYRGEIAQAIDPDQEDWITLEDNTTIPRIPKVTYVNFDAETLSMNGVGERPWDRAFFRDTAMTLLEIGKARSVGFDFGFTPKSMSSMVPKENSYRSDLAMGNLVSAFPEQVVLGCLYSGVPTPFVKGIEASAFPPMFVDGYSLQSGKFSYPESPTYPLQSYQDGNYLGRMGSFTVPPFRAVDEVPRWVPLWFPAGGKAHAYNILGGKKSVLGFELPSQNESEIKELTEKLSELRIKDSSIERKLGEVGVRVASLSEDRNHLSEKISKLEDGMSRIQSIDQEIKTLQETLKANSALQAVLGVQIKNREDRRDVLLVEVHNLLGGKIQKQNGTEAVVEEIERVSGEIKNFSLTLEANPGLAAVIEPQISQRKNRVQELRKIIERSAKNNSDNSLSEVKKDKLRLEIKNSIKTIQEKLDELMPRLAGAASKLAELKEQSSTSRQTISKTEKLLLRYQGKEATELVEYKDTLRLVYKRDQGDEGPGKLIESLPNVMPLYKEGNVYTLGLECLLAYYGLDHQNVRIAEDKSSLSIIAKNGKVIAEAPLVEDQWLEVNWFSSWTDNLPEKELVREAKRAFGDQDLPEYLRLVPEIFRLFLERVDGLNVPINNAELPESMESLGVESSLVEIAKKLLESSPGDPEIPSFESFKRVINGIAYYFIPPSVLSPYNPMCGMKDILDYANFHDQVSENINALSQFINRLKGPEYLGKIELALGENPKDSNFLAQKKKIERALNENMQNLAIQNEEMERIENFFGTFKDSIVLIGPEEKTFQDLAPTPFDSAAVPKVSVHGNLIKTLTTGEFLHRLPIRVDHAATLLISILMAFLAVYQGNHASWVQAGGILLLLGYVFLSFETFAQSHVVWPISAPACAGLSTSFIGLAVMVVIEQKAKGKLKGMFGSYVSSDLVEQMVASGEEPSLGGEETSITAFFSDVQAFSSFSELLTPTGLVDLMNEYLTAMTNILQEERGTLDKYIGDAIVAMYGAPIPMKDHAYQAVRTSILMQQKQIELRKKWVPEVEKWGKCHGLVTQMQTRIGCNTGTATVGNMGALDRFNYTMMGDMVNLAARCESGAKAYGAYIMVTEETKLASEKTRDDIAFRYLDKIVVKGRSQPVAMYEPTGFMSELSQETQDCLDCFKQGIDRYLLQDWDGALSLFEKAKGMEPNKPGVTPGVKDNPSMILIDRCKVMKENPPGDDWDGVYVMTTK